MKAEAFTAKMASLSLEVQAESAIEDLSASLFMDSAAREEAEVKYVSQGSMTINLPYLSAT